MSRAIVFLVISMLMLAMPEMMNSLTSVTFSGAGDSALNNSMSEMMKSMNSIIGAMSYMMGIAFGFKAMLAFKEYGENPYYSENKNEEQPKINLTKENMSEEKKEEDVSVIFNKKVDEKTEIKPIEKEEFKFNLDFEHELLNNKLSDIEKIISFIISLPALENDIENKLLVSSTQTKYVTEVYKAYVAIPKELRDRIVRNSTATSLAMEQLILIENGLREVENQILTEQLKDLNVMNRFLKEKFPEQKKEYITLGK